MKILQTSTKMADAFRDFSKLGITDHASRKRLLKHLTMPEFQVRIVKYFKSSAARYTELMDMEEQNA